MGKSREGAESEARAEESVLREQHKPPEEVVTRFALRAVYLGERVYIDVLYSSSARRRSASRAAMQPVPADVYARRHTCIRVSKIATPELEGCWEEDLRWLDGRRDPGRHRPRKRP